MNTVRKGMETTAPPAHARVRTPGKHIVMFLTAAVVVVAAAVNLVDASNKSKPGAVATAPGAAASVAGEFAIPEFLVDLSPDRSGRDAYLRLIAVVRAAPGATDAVEQSLKANEAAVSERITFLLRGLSADDFDGEEKLQRVKKEILRRVNLVIAPARAEDVVIAELTVQ